MFILLWWYRDQGYRELSPPHHPGKVIGLFTTSQISAPSSYFSIGQLISVEVFPFLNLPN